MTVKKCGGPVDPTLQGCERFLEPGLRTSRTSQFSGSKLRASCHALRAPSLLAHLCRHSYLTWNSWYIYKICMYARTYYVGRYVCMYAWVHPNSSGRFVSSRHKQRPLGFPSLKPGCRCPRMPTWFLGKHKSMVHWKYVDLLRGKEPMLNIQCIVLLWLITVCVYVYTS